MRFSNNSSQISLNFLNFIIDQNLTPMTLSDQAVIQTLKAEPAVILTSNGKPIFYPFPSPADWRDLWIYFLVVDKFIDMQKLNKGNVISYRTNEAISGGFSVMSHIPPKEIS